MCAARRPGSRRLSRCDPEEAPGTGPPGRAQRARPAAGRARSRHARLGLAGVPSSPAKGHPVSSKPGFELFPPRSPRAHRPLAQTVLAPAGYSFLAAQPAHPRGERVSQPRGPSRCAGRRPEQLQSVRRFSPCHSGEASENRPGAVTIRWKSQESCCFLWKRGR
jgi:hypothetical protein